MPLKTRKPCYRIDRLKDRYVITAYPVVNRQLVMGGQVEVGRGDQVELKEAAEALIRATRERFVPKEK